MTTIACNRETMAADLQYSNLQTGLKFKGSPKIYKFKANENTYLFSDFIIGFCGSASDVCTAVAYFTKPELFEKQPKLRGISGLVMTEDNELYMFEDYRQWMAVHEKYAAVGSGCAYALGAMAEGATPKEAIKVASKHDIYTGMGVKELKF